MKKIILIAFIVAVLNPFLVYAAEPDAKTTEPVKSGVSSDLPTYNSGVDNSIKDYLCTPSEPADGHDLERCVNRLYRFSLVTGFLVLIFFLVISGYVYITGGEGGKTKAKAMLINSFTGMAILLGSYVLLYFINPSLVQFKQIQPPIFDAADMPSCADVGFGEKCMASDGGISFGGMACAMPLADSVVSGYNNTVHNPWDEDPGTPDKHRTVRKIPNGPPPTGAVDLKVSKPAVPIYSPISGKVDKYGDLGRVGKYITITTDLSGSGCGNASGCASLAHIEPSVKVGDTVKAGQQVGVSTVYSGGLGPHLHLELKLGGQWITGDGKAGTWSNMKSAISKCSSGSSGGNAPAGLVDAKTIVPDLVVDMQYATAKPSSNNFTKTALYTGNSAKYGTSCYLTKEMADKLKKAQDELTKLKSGWKIKAWDCFRPMDVQQKMYDIVMNDKDPTNDGLVAKPNDKAQHPRGVAIDATLVDASGKTVTMPTIFDYFNTKTNTQRPNSTSYNNAPGKANSELLNTVMSKANINRASSEWWHFGL